MKNTNDSRRIRYAVVGLGWFAQAAALPAFNSADNSELVALISDDQKKREELSKQYGIKRTYAYEEYEDCLISGEVDAVYIALPNHLHRDYTVRAANRAIHVLCEKPMAVTEEDCEAMIKAANDNGVKLMIAYRLHLEPANLQAVEIVRSQQQIGEPRFFNSIFTQPVEEGNIRLRKTTGGGTLYDIGIYCINAARYLFQSEPTEVFAVAASQEQARFNEVEEMTSAILRFPDQRLATFTCSFGASKVSTYQVVGTKGDLRVEPAYSWHENIQHQMRINDRIQKRTFERQDQLAAEFTYFSDCILQGREPEPSGKEGFNDVRIIRALYQSMETNQPIQLTDLFERDRRPTSAQTVERPAPQGKPDLIRAAAPAGSA
jgi:glucose-fructose oxidoreductase